MPEIEFSSLDYILFFGMLLLSVAIGVYFGFCEKKQNNRNEYLLGGKNMKVLPVAASLIASHISGVTILSLPADVYLYGSNYMWMGVVLPIVSLLTAYVFLPVFFNLGLTSVYEYLNLRFHKKVRIFASFLFTLQIFFFNPIVVYIPSLALSQVTGINLNLINPLVCVVCIFYTTIGGLKAVVWTDALQFAGIIGGSIAVVLIGVWSVGGFVIILETNVKGHRLDVLDFTFDPTVRDGFWPLILGGTIHWISICAINQMVIQKLLSISTIKNARRVILLYCFGMVVMKLLSCFTGNIMYAKYSKCDPLSTKQVERNDQLLPYFVMEVASSVPGIAGIFVAGVFSAALSTLSSSLNTVSGTIYEDIISPFLPANITEKRISNILKLIVFVAGVICTILVMVVEKMDGIFPLHTALQAVTGGPLVGLFCLGLFFPMANSKGALYGGVSGLIFISWILLSNQWYKGQGLIKDNAKPLCTDGCNFRINHTSVSASHAYQPFILYRISFWYNTLLSAIFVIIVGLIISWFTKNNHDQCERSELFCPIVHRFLSKKRKSTNIPVDSVNMPLTITTKTRD